MRTGLFGKSCSRRTTSQVCSRPTDLIHGRPSSLGSGTKLRQPRFDQPTAFSGEEGDRSLKTNAKWILRAVLALGLFCTICLAVKFGLTRMACGTEEKLKVVELSGLRFEVTYLSCDTLAKDEAIRVYAETTAPDRAWFFPSWRNQRTLLFRYDPEKDNSPLPIITRPSPSTILISVPEVSSISYQNREWAKMSINYSIGRVEYPTSPNK